MLVGYLVLPTFASVLVFMDADMLVRVHNLLKTDCLRLQEILVQILELT